MDRLRLTLNSHRLAAFRLRVPLVIGEWGHLDTLPEGPGRDRYATGAANVLDRWGAVGAAYWEHRPGDAQNGKLDTVLRPYPRRVMGRILGRTGYDPTTRTLTLRFLPKSGSAPTVLAAPRRLFPHGVTLRAQGGVSRWRYLPERGLVLVHADPNTRLVQLQISPKPKAAPQPEATK